MKLIGLRLLALWTFTLEERVDDFNLISLESLRLSFSFVKIVVPILLHSCYFPYYVPTASAVQGQSDATSIAAGSSETAGAKKSKTPGNETSLLDRLLKRLQDNRLQSGDPETARKLQEINRSQNASNIILKKILNIAFVTTGVALLLSVIFVIVYTSIGKRLSTPVCLSVSLSLSLSLSHQDDEADSCTHYIIAYLKNAS